MAPSQLGAGTHLAEPLRHTLQRWEHFRASLHEHGWCSHLQEAMVSEYWGNLLLRAVHHTDGREGLLSADSDSDTVGRTWVFFAFCRSGGTQLQKSGPGEELRSPPASPPTGPSSPAPGLPGKPPIDPGVVAAGVDVGGGTIAGGGAAGGGAAAAAAGAEDSSAGALRRRSFFRPKEAGSVGTATATLRAGLRFSSGRSTNALATASAACARSTCPSGVAARSNRLSTAAERLSVLCTCASSDSTVAYTRCGPRQRRCTATHRHGQW